ncbi:tRNA (Uracil-5-)-methyltransferase family protein, partial [Vibrio parahaemolyticus V-223/04]
KRVSCTSASAKSKASKLRK